MTTTPVRQFTIGLNAVKFVIMETQPIASGRVSGYYSEDDALALAAAQHRPVIRAHRDGTRETLGVLFDPDEFERAAYSGHISYQVSMTDGHYAPEPFERWVHLFRQDPTWRCNDAAYAIRDALDTYKARIAACAASTGTAAAL